MLKKFNEVVSKFIIKPDHFLIYDNEAICIYVNHIIIDMDFEHMKITILDDKYDSKEYIKITDFYYINILLKEIYSCKDDYCDEEHYSNKLGKEVNP